MTIICHCRGISDTDLKEAFDTFRNVTYGAAPESMKDLAPLLGDYNCGGCSRIFDRAVQQFQDTGEIHLFKRAGRRRQSQSTEGAGLCDHAQNHSYSADGLPDLKGSPIQGAPV